MVDQGVPRQELKLTETLSVSDEDKELIIIPDIGATSRVARTKVTYAFKFNSPVLLTQLVSLEINEDLFASEIAPARTFCFQHEVEALKAQGLGKGGSSDNVVIIDDLVSQHHQLSQLS